MARKRKPEIRVFVDEDLDRLLKALAGLKDTSLSGLVNEAIEFFIQENEEARELIDRHNLDQIKGDDE
ncbi:hypothetical protein [Egbenema bharatensis]|uniref:hypothetical protein n=1 Tax=Egbenema bharatensis TaxID=3463334 RepID=UPI003A8B12D8